MSEDGDIYLRTVPVEGNTTKFPLEHDSPIAVAAREVQQSRKANGENILVGHPESEGILNTFADQKLQA